LYPRLAGMVSLAALVVRDKGGEQHMGEKGKDGEAALCLLLCWEIPCTQVGLCFVLSSLFSFKGSRELKNVECSINYYAKGASHYKKKKPVLVTPWIVLV
jgi:hypothetical protein